MNFRELINKLDQINEAESTLTLQSIADVEKTAMDKAVAEKAKGGFSGFAAWDPRSAGNIAVATLAQQNNLEGLFNSEGDFVIAYGTRSWSSKPGESPRRAPPTPDDWKPLAAMGLIPQNAKGPAGLTNWLTSGGAQKEFDAVKKQSADAATPGNATKATPGNATKASPNNDAKVISADEEEKMTLLEGLVDQYLALKATGAAATKVTAPVKGSGEKTNSTASPVDYSLNGNSSSDSDGTALRTAGAGTAGYLLANKPAPGTTGIKKFKPSLRNVLGATAAGLIGSEIKESKSISTSLVESFGYQKKNSFESIVESFGYQTEQEESRAIDYAPDMEISDADRYKPADTRNIFAKNSPVPDAVRALRNTISGKNKRTVSKEPQKLWDALVRNKYWEAWTEDTLSWDNEIIPSSFTAGGETYSIGFMDGAPLYTFADLGIDLGIATTLTLAGGVLAPFTAGASVPIAAATGIGATAIMITGRILARLIIAAAKALWRVVSLWGKPFWEIVKRNPREAKKAFGQWARTYLESFYDSAIKNFSKAQFGWTVLVTMGFNGFVKYWEKYGEPWYEENVPDSIKKPIGQLANFVADQAKKTFNYVRKQTGLEEGLA